MTNFDDFRRRNLVVGPMGKREVEEGGGRGRRKEERVRGGKGEERGGRERGGRRKSRGESYFFPAVNTPKR